MATTGGGGAGAVRVSGVPSGGVSGAGAAADDVGSVIDFLSGADFGRVAFLSQAGRVLGSDEQIYSTPVAATGAQRNDHHHPDLLARGAFAYFWWETYACGRRVTCVLHFRWETYGRQPAT